jgi:hypothetical protein
MILVLETWDPIAGSGKRLEPTAQDEVKFQGK